uniref:Non-haem dioxygenase N-terminal domain-containing protein n=1 Tax=Romanomermis culicivorax TaxID=13658 RepID=A0A915HFV0_ROMCU
MVILTDENSSFDSFPIISLEKFLTEKSKQALEEAANSVDYALTNFGAFYLIDHGIEARVLDKVLKDLKTFFLKPVEEKRIYELKDNYRSAVDDLAFSLKKILSTAMGQEENFLEKLTYRAAPMMKANFYPACEKMSKDQPRLAEHTDVVPMTIMLQDDTK